MKTFPKKKRWETKKVSLCKPATLSSVEPYWKMKKRERKKKLQAESRTCKNKIGWTSNWKNKKYKIKISKRESEMERREIDEKHDKTFYLCNA